MGLSMRVNVAFLAILLAAIANQSGQKCIQKLDETYVKSILYGTLASIASISVLICLDIIRQNPANSHDFESLLEQYFYLKRHIMHGRWIWKTLQYATKRSQENQEKKLLEVLKAKKIARIYGYKQIPNLYFFEDNIPLSDYSAILKLQAQSNRRGNLTFKKYKAESLMEYISFKNNKNMLGRPLILLQGWYNQKRISALHPQTDFLYSIFRHRSFWCYPKQIFETPDEETYLFLVAIYSLKEREISYIIACDSSMLHALWSLISTKWQEICNIIESGRIPGKLRIDNDEMLDVLDSFKGSYSRAAELRKEFNKGFVGIASRIWTQCAYVQTLATEVSSPEWGALATRELSHMPKLASCYYLDTDIIAAPETLYSDNYFVPNLQSYFVEWIPEDQFDMDTDWPDTRTSSEVEIGKSYEMVLTSYDCQFLRSRTGLMANIVGMTNGHPSFSFGCSNELSLNIDDEETRVDLLGEILKGTCKRLGGSLVNFAATESVTESFNIDSLRSYRMQYSGIGRVSYHYVLFIEVHKHHDENQYNSTELLMFDKDLCLTLPPYRRVRQLKKLAPIKVIEVEPGSFQRLRSVMSKDCNIPPSSTPKILRTPKYLEFLLSQSKVNSYKWKSIKEVRY